MAFVSTFHYSLMIAFYITVITAPEICYC